MTQTQTSCFSRPISSVVSGPGLRVLAPVLHCPSLINGARSTLSSPLPCFKPKSTLTSLCMLDLLPSSYHYALYARHTTDYYRTSLVCVCTVVNSHTLWWQEVSVFHSCSLFYSLKQGFSPNSELVDLATLVSRWVLRMCPSPPLSGITDMHDYKHPFM